jgi:hypothetical protein
MEIRRGQSFLKSKWLICCQTQAYYQNVWRLKSVRKLMILVLFATSISIILFGCQSFGNNGVEEENISKVSISKSNGFGKVNKDFYVVYDDKENLETFKAIFSSSVKEAGIADMAEPDYDLEVIYSDGIKKGYHLWVGDQGQRSMFMDVEDTHTIYTVPGKMTNQLIELVK